ncbi:MAG: hypothetical protein HY278_10520 [candidate division NC10 bacterium]|nr:hypothetical protein [candidate division NC10 bacterium]
MRKIQADPVLTASQYEELGELLTATAGMVIFAHVCAPGFQESNKTSILMNGLARAAKTLDGVLALYKTKDYQDCWVLVRGMLERYFHLNYLRTTGEYDEFEAWSFWEQYNIRNKMRSDHEIKGKLDKEFFSDTSAQKARIREFAKDPPSWNREHPAVSAERLDLEFLYDFLYRFGSTQTHPYANDGYQDLHSLTGMGLKENFPDQRTVLHNACLLTIMLMGECMIGTGRQWHGMLERFLDECMDYLKNGDARYQATFVQFKDLGPDFEWCRSKPTDGEQAS